MAPPAPVKRLNTANNTRVHTPVIFMLTYSKAATSNLTKYDPTCFINWNHQLGDITNKTNVTAHRKLPAKLEAVLCWEHNEKKTQLWDAAGRQITSSLLLQACFPLFARNYSPMISLQGFSAVMGTLQVGHWLAFFNHISMQDEQNTWWLEQITGCLTCTEKNTSKLTH